MPVIFLISKSLVEMHVYITDSKVLYNDAAAEKKIMSVLLS
jgi:hypothetical protein